MYLQYIYANENKKSNIQIEEEYEIKDLANLIGKSKIDVENVLGKGLNLIYLAPSSLILFSINNFVPK